MECRKRLKQYWEGENVLRDPYEVLEINKGATKEEIQKAYRRLVKKYHPDQYRNHPLQKLAEEKLAEVNEAYDYLMKNGGASGSYSGSRGSSQYNSGSDNSFFQQVRIYINNGDLYTAEQMLNQSNNRTAQWYYSKRNHIPEERLVCPGPVSLPNCC